MQFRTYPERSGSGGSPLCHFQLHRLLRIALQNGDSAKADRRLGAIGSG